MTVYSQVGSYLNETNNLQIHSVQQCQFQQERTGSLSMLFRAVYLAIDSKDHDACYSQICLGQEQQKDPVFEVSKYVFVAIFQRIASMAGRP